jgi:hypothetical protein
MACSAEGEGVSLNACIKKTNFEGMIRYAVCGAHQLIQALSGHDAIAVRIGVHAMSRTGHLAVDGYVEADPVTRGRRTEHKVQVTCVEAVDDTAASLVQLRALRADRPVTRQGPVVEPRLSDSIDMALVLHHTAR